eukprot:CAMPEP_0184387924 /NCGR_PEP_ID=MMETSP0007-20130409/11185_1 /TAXON_ID=97485 /ORGANISM="Prymnesium parvum, Strain Texoma1" /LENGTH=47 /DNA_ID= /DNA_START= /DNA_END= /DNA_ORIENTATION=
MREVGAVVPSGDALEDLVHVNCCSAAMQRQLLSLLNGAHEGHASFMG